MSFIADYAARLNHRAATFTVAIDTALQRKLSVIVETGCVRDFGNWAGDGQSTIVFDHLANAVGATLWSVDCSSESIVAARSVASAATQLVLGDSVSFLDRFPGTIDLLYLDSLDGDKSGSAEHCLAELNVALPKLSRGAVVLMDDTFVSSGRVFGKGALAVDRLKDVGAVLLLQGYQSAWQIK